MYNLNTCFALILARVARISHLISPNYLSIKRIPATPIIIVPQNSIQFIFIFF